MKADPLLVTMFAGGGVGHMSGGVGTLILYLLDEWATCSEAPRVRVIDTRGQGGKVGVILHFIKAIVLLLYLAAMRRLGIVHVHMCTNGSALRKSILCVLCSLLGAPVIVHLHGADFYEFYARLPGCCQKVIQFVLNRARHVIVLGEGWRDFLVSEVGIRPQKIAIIANGVRPPVPMERRQSQPGEPLRIVFLGRIGERKGVPELLTAFESPQLLSRSWTATMAGDGPVERYRALVAEAGLQARVMLPGWVNREHASRLLAEADIFVLPSHHEVMPIAVLEALAHGVAVVTTPVGAIPEFLADGETALLVPPGAPAKLADAMARLIDDPAERHRLSAAGHRVFCEKLDISVVADRILALYRSAVLPAQNAARQVGTTSADDPQQP